MKKNELSKSSSRKASKYRGPSCLNCGHPLDLTDKYCANCSQLNTTKQLSITDFFNEFFSSIFTYDSRLRYTLKDLLFKPGTITKNYVEGQRLKYANPFRFFLSVSIIFFIIQGLINNLGLPNGDSAFKVNNNPIENVNEIKDEIKKAAKDNNIITNPDSLTQIFDSIIQGEGSTVSLTELIKPKKKKNTKYLTEADYDTIQWSNRTIERAFQYRKYYNDTKIKNPDAALDSLKHKKTKLNKWIYSKNDAIDRAVENPFGFANFLMGKIPFFLFFFAPFFAFFFWILYSKKKYNYMEHLVFIFHILSFVFLALLICLIPDLIFGTDAFMGITLAFIGPFYFYKALRNFYKQNRFITIFKFVILNNIFFISATIAAIIFFTLTAAVY
ncbi:MAG: DUF3667 domain-containing protein [Flavobacteriaceae bacterium]|nr:DUF3667 domain-containing protein [Flavobacteriaceae bacterium]